MLHVTCNWRNIPKCKISRNNQPCIKISFFKLPWNYPYIGSTQCSICFSTCYFLWLIFLIICPVNSFPNITRWLIDWSHSKFILIIFFFLTTYNGSLAVLYGDRLYRRKKNIQRHDIEFIYYIVDYLETDDWYSSWI